MQICDNEPIVYLSFSSEINPETTENIFNALNACINAKVKTIYILFTCVGGNAVNGFNIYNFLKNIPCEIIMHNIGEVDSIGTLIFLGAKTRYATANSIFLFHGMTHDTRYLSNPVYDRISLLTAYNSIDNQQDRLLKEYIHNTLFTADEINKLFIGDNFITPVKAREKGVISRICDFEIKANAPIMHISQHGLMQK